MHLIDSDGATLTNRFTEGDPESLIPATIVSAAIANAWQLEIANTIVLGANTALLTSGTDTFLQLKTAIQTMLKIGPSVNPFTFAIVNNQASAIDVTGVVFDKTKQKAVNFKMYLYRVSSLENLLEVGDLWMVYNAGTDTWSAEVQSLGSDAGVTFTVTATGQLQYTSTNVSGTGYVGTLTLAHEKQVNFDVALLSAP